MKVCPHCKALINPNGESPAHFARRKYCSRTCTTAARIGSKAPWATSDKLDPEMLERRGRNISAAKTGAFGTVEERFWSKVNKTDSCWVWTAARDDNGYGLFRPDGRRGRLVRAHIWALEQVLGRPLGSGLNSLHTCDNPPCVRHLYEGTDEDNARDRDSRGRANVRVGELHGKAVLTDEIVVECRRRYVMGGVTYRELAQEFDVSIAAMAKAVLGRNWKHIP